jgi:hypothetical protein
MAAGRSSRSSKCDKGRKQVFTGRAGTDAGPSFFRLKAPGSRPILFDLLFSPYSSSCFYSLVYMPEIRNGWRGLGYSLARLAEVLAILFAGYMIYFGSNPGLHCSQCYDRQVQLG